jgi:hypothetical protein
MSTDVETQIHGYASQLDESQVSIDASEVFALRETVRLLPSQERPAQHRPWLVAAAAFAAVLVLVGGATWLFTATESNGPVATTPPIDAVSYDWSRVGLDDTVFGGEGGQQMKSATAGGPGFVAVGSSGSIDDGDAAVWTSVDGITWSRVPHDEEVFGGPDSQRMLSVIAAGPGLVAVGADGSVTGRHWAAAAWTSIDGVTWSRVPHDEAVFGGAESQAMASVTVGGPGLVAVGGPGHGWDEGGDAAVWTSVDGITWSRVPHSEEVFGGARVQWMSGVTTGGPGLVAVGYDSQGPIHNDSDAAVWTSVDGITWSRVPHDETALGGQGSQDMTDVTAGGLGLVAVGSDQPGDDVPAGPSSDAAVWTSVDGITWSRVPQNEAVFAGTGGQRMTAVIATDRGLVAVGSDGGGYGTRSDGAVWTSTDGVSWSRVAHDEAVFGGTRMSSLTAADPGLVAVGSDWLGENGDVDAVVWVATPAD